MVDIFYTNHSNLSFVKPCLKGQLWNSKINAPILWRKPGNWEKQILNGHLEQT